MQFQFYPAVTPFEHSLLSKDWSRLRHVLLVRSGDGRFASALRSVLPQACRLVCLESRESLVPDVGPEVMGGEWSFPEIEDEVGRYGKFDCMIFVHFHEFWAGKVGSLSRMMEFLDSGGFVWFQYLNGSCLEVLDGRLQAGGLQGRSLSSPFYAAPPLDLQGMAHWGNSLGLVCDEIWGYVGHRLFKWMTGKSKKEIKLELLKRNYPIRSALEGVGAGAHVLGVRLRHRHFDETRQVEPRISVAEMSPAGLQMFLIPHPHVDDRESDEWQARAQIKAWRTRGRPDLSPMRRRMLDEFTEDQSVEKVLLVGGAYAGDLFLLAKLYDQWNWCGVDHDSSLVSLWCDAMSGEPEVLESWDPQSSFPFEDSSFDLVVSLGAFSRCNPALALRYASEMVRVSRRHVAHLEDAAGPARDSFKRTVPLPSIYQRLGWRSDARPVLKEGKDTGWITLFLELPQDRTGGPTEAASGIDETE